MTTSDTPIRVLVVEDDADLLELLSMLLSDHGFAVDTAHQGLEALERVGAKMPDVILLDMHMPVMDGWQFAREFRGRYDGQAPIVVLTAAEDSKRRAAEIHADAWLGKPFNLDDVVAMIPRVVRSRETAKV
jgi:DNA-binding response OmpR family regulator